MSPLFPCSGCGVQIERSLHHYLQQRGQVLCSTCKDRRTADSSGSSSASGAAVSAPPPKAPPDPPDQA